MALTDKRLRFCNEALQGIRIVKFFGWEASYVERILGIRKEELRHAKSESYVFVLCMIVTVFFPIL